MIIGIKWTGKRLFLLGCVGLATIARATAGDSAVLTAEFINPHAPYRSCHASTIAETPEHDLVAAWFGGTAERNPDVGIWVARCEHGTWLPAVEVANGVQRDGPRQPTWNPVLFQRPSGPLLLFFKVGPSPEKWWGMLMTSSDGGRTWSEPRRLPDGVLGPIKNKPVLLPDGTLLCGSSTESSALGWHVHFERSTDTGRTWTLAPEVAADGFNVIQPTILFHPGGKLQMLCRSKEGMIVQAWSSDRGNTWSKLAATSLPNPNSGIDAVTLADGRQLLVYNHSGPTLGRKGSGPRYPLNVALSADGSNWTSVLVLEDQPDPSGYAYPAVIQTSDGLVHITYTWHREMIKHVVLDLRRF